MSGREGAFRRPPPPAPERPRGLWSTFFENRQAGWGAIGVVAAAVAAGLFLWSRVSDDVRLDAGYALEADAIEVRGVAPWVMGDLKREALRAASLNDPLPLDDPELSRRLARAFDMHPWVRRVVRVDLVHPARAVVEVACREPAAVVAVQGGLLAIDGEGTVLPSDDFTPEAAARYPRIEGITTSPQGPEGTPWGDPVVEEAAALAVAIGPEWADLGLASCRPDLPGGRRSWVLTDGNGRTIRFGSAPGREVTGEPSAAAKVARLQSLAEGRDDVDLTATTPAAPAPISARP